MANTFNQLSYANTFGDWVILSNYHSTELNAIGKGNYVKDTGLLTLGSPGIALQVANNALFQGNVAITGAGSSLQVSNDVLVSGNLIVKGNTTISINEIDYGTIISNNFTANSATIINLTTTNSTSNLVTSNTLSITRNAYIGGDLTVTGNTNISLDEVVAGNGTFSKNVTVGGNLTVAGNTNITLNEIVVGDITSNTLHIIDGVASNSMSVNILTGNSNNQIYQTISDTANNTVGTALAFSIALG